MRDQSQTSDTVLLVRPACFGFHAEAAQSNAFASPGENVGEAALAEFDGLRARLEAAGVRCVTLDDSEDDTRPDATFPNNWVSFHGDGSVIVYPMATRARRLERRLDAVAALVGADGFRIGPVIDLSSLEDRGEYLEGTGSLVLDRPNSLAFACRSPRTTDGAVSDWEKATGWDVILFDAADRDGRPVYHTNVLLSLGTSFALLCADAIAPADRDRVIAAIEDSGRTLINVSLDQMERFACNAIELRATDARPMVALSTTALDSLSTDQRETLERLGGELVAVPIPTIERVGGGSVRCMIAEVHLPRR